MEGTTQPSTAGGQVVITMDKIGSQRKTEGIFHLPLVGVGWNAELIQTMGGVQPSYFLENKTVHHLGEIGTK
jgi:hypothetical protein